jgi:hypothetical protein
MPRIVPNGGYSVQTPARWNIRPGMKPIPWTISPYVKTLAADPFYGRYDIAGAVKRGVENWNAAFGYKVLEAKVGAADATPGDDVTNFIYLDVNPAVGFAFADWRTNPNTGEIRGASVYLNTIWVDIGSFLFDPDAFNARPRKPDIFAAAPKARHRLGWAGMRPETLCEYPVSPLLGEDLATVSSRIRVQGAPGSAGRTGIQMVEDYVAGVVLHEIGHTLGLRHNFKGSLVPPSTRTAPASTWERIRSTSSSGRSTRTPWGPSSPTRRSRTSRATSSPTASSPTCAPGRTAPPGRPRTTPPSTT